MAAPLVDQATRVDSKVTGGTPTVLETKHESERSDISDPDAEQSEESYQRGVRQARAITTIWNKNTLWMMFAL